MNDPYSSGSSVNEFYNYITGGANGLTANIDDLCIYKNYYNMFSFSEGNEETQGGGGDTTPPTWSNNKTSPNSPVTYSSGANYQFNVTVTDDTEMDKVFLEFDGTNYTMSNQSSEYYYTLSDLAAGSYSFKYYMNDTSDNWNTSDSWTYTINKASSVINLLLNGTDGDVSYLNQSYANFTVTLDIGFNVNLTTNMTNWADQLNKPEPYENISLIECSINNTYYNITGWWDGNQNYTSSVETHYAKCYEGATTTTTTTTTSTTTTTTIPASSDPCTADSEGANIVIPLGLILIAFVFGYLAMNSKGSPFLQSLFFGACLIFLLIAVSVLQRLGEGCSYSSETMDILKKSYGALVIFTISFVIYFVVNLLINSISFVGDTFGKRRSD